MNILVFAFVFLFYVRSTSAGSILLTDSIITTSYILGTCGKAPRSDIEGVLKILPGYVASCSHGLVKYSNTVVGPIDVPCGGGCDIDTWTASIKKKYLNRTRLNLLFLPQGVNCPWAALGVQSCFNTGRGTECFAWIAAPSADTILHEIGHNLGLYHSWSLGGGEYGDTSCIMGASNGLVCFNSPQSWALGWADWISDLGAKDIPVGNETIIIDIPIAESSYKNFVRLRASHTGLLYNVFISYRVPRGFDAAVIGAYLYLHSYVGGLAIQCDTTSPVLIKTMSVGESWRTPNVTVYFTEIYNKNLARIMISHT